MKQKQRNNDVCCSEWTTKEREVAEILLVWERRRLFLNSVPSSWVCRKKRSVLLLQDTSSSPSSSQPHHHGGGAAVVAPSCPVVVKEQASRPATPLSFPAATESDEKPKKTSLKRKREYYLQLIEDLTKSKADRNQEIENAKLHYDQLKAINLNLKAREQLLRNAPKSECKNPNWQIDKPLQLSQSNFSVHSSNPTAENEDQKKRRQQQQQMLMPNHQTQNFGNSQIISTNASYHPTLLPMACSSSTSIFGRNKGPLPRLPDLNLSIEELSNVDLSQPLYETATNMDFSRVMAAQARKRRLQIFRLKKPIGV